jgi:hypothetical protein
VCRNVCRLVSGRVADYPRYACLERLNVAGGLAVEIFCYMPRVSCAVWCVLLCCCVAVFRAVGRWVRVAPSYQLLPVCCVLYCTVEYDRFCVRPAAAVAVVTSVCCAVQRAPGGRQRVYLCLPVRQASVNLWASTLPSTCVDLSVVTPQQHPPPPSLPSPPRPTCAPMSDS